MVGVDYSLNLDRILFSVQIFDLTHRIFGIMIQTLLMRLKITRAGGRREWAFKILILSYVKIECAVNDGNCITQFKG